MADFDEAPYTHEEDEEQLWGELDKCVSSKCDSHETIDDALRTWIDLTTRLRDHLYDSQEEVVTCTRMLLASDLFQANKDYVRTQIIYSLLQEDEAGPLHAIVSLLLLDGCQDETMFPRMVNEACFPRLLELINGRRDQDPGLHRLLLQLMYEMSRMERLRVDDLTMVEDEFVHYLFALIEELSDDAHDPYHYPTIRVLLVLNEQYMLASTEVDDSASPNSPLTNRIVKCLSLHGASFRTFGENIILLLNRETETSLQLLILKLLYLLFTNKATYEYFYTNDLRVLLDVIIRNLMDLPDEKMSLRHTYLRVLYPLLAHTQLSQPPHYKQDEILRLKRSRVQTPSRISGGDVATDDDKPGVPMATRPGNGSDFARGDQNTAMAICAKKPLPEVPKHPLRAPPPQTMGTGRRLKKPPTDPVQERRSQSRKHDKTATIPVRDMNPKQKASRWWRAPVLRHMCARRETSRFEDGVCG
ncbi:hypothetical protein CEK25_007453 [Fusarium fujikuroi]|nr:hypothetical protein CEK25_007453 [Fusarium fujikuroi]